jgi:hypothetical protein
MNGGGVQLTTVFTRNLVNEMRVGAIQRTTQNTPQDPLPGAINAFINMRGTKPGSNRAIASNHFRQSTLSLSPRMLRRALLEFP